MKTICTLAVTVTTLTFLQPAEAGWRSSSHSSVGSPAHFSAPSRSYSAPSRSYSAPSRSYSGPSRSVSSAQRFNAPARFSSGANFHNRNAIANGPRFSGTTQFRNPGTNWNRTRFDRNRTTAFNSGVTNATANHRFNPSQRNGPRVSGTNRERVVGRYSANWNRHWDRRRDHWWHGRRCHFHNNVWVIYEPFFWYPYTYGYGYGYGYYPYDSYYDSGAYYDDGYQPTEYSQTAYTPQSEEVDDSRVSEVQRALARAGYYDGAIDGEMGADTRRALRRYQSDRGLPVTGTITRGVIESLRLR